MILVPSDVPAQKAVLPSGQMNWLVVVLLKIVRVYRKARVIWRCHVAAGLQDDLRNSQGDRGSERRGEEMHLEDVLIIAALSGSIGGGNAW